MNPQDLAIEQQLQNTQIPREKLFESTDPLSLDIPDEKLVKIIDKRIEASRRFWKQKYNLYERRKKNEMYLLGRQINNKEDRGELKIYEARFMDNALYEIESTIKPIAMQQMPDLLVGPHNDSPEAQDTADSLTSVVNDDLKKRANRIVLSIAFKHLPVGYVGVIKEQWNPELGQFGDYEFVNVHYDYIDLDHTAKTSDANDHEFISEICPTTVQMCLMRFPEKKREFFEELQKHGLFKGQEDFKDEDLATEIQIRQIWFKWYKKGEEVKSSKDETMDDNITEPGVKWEVIRGVIWKYEKCILKKIKNPNYDYQGEEKYVVYDNPQEESSKRVVTAREMFESAVIGQPIQNMKKETVYRNYLQRPRVPYFLMTYDQWNKVAIDETSRIEQNLRNQQNMDHGGKNIQEKLASNGKNVFSKESGLQTKDIERMDWQNRSQDLIVDGNVNNTYLHIPADVPEAQEFENLDRTLNRMKALAGVTAVGGQLQTDVATSNQIGRESNFTTIDDLVENTINAAAEWEAQGAMQFIKLRYTQAHMKYILGAKGKMAFISMKSNMIDQGQVVRIKASGTDKLKAHNEAQQMWQDQAIDPINFYRDMGFEDYKERADMFMTYMMDKVSYQVKFVQGLETTGQQVGALAQQPVPGGPPAPGAVPPQGAPMPQGQPLPQPAPTNPVNPTPGNTSAVPISPPVGPPAASPRAI